MCVQLNLQEQSGKRSLHISDHLYYHDIKFIHRYYLRTHLETQFEIRQQREISLRHSVFLPYENTTRKDCGLNRIDSVFFSRRFLFVFGISTGILCHFKMISLPGGNLNQLFLLQSQPLGRVTVPRPTSTKSQIILHPPPLIYINRWIRERSCCETLSIANTKAARTIQHPLLSSMESHFINLHLHSNRLWPSHFNNIKDIIRPEDISLDDPTILL